MKPTFSRIAIFLLMAVSAFASLSVFSYSTSFLYESIYIFDQSIFEMIGGIWADGGLPYVDAWDSKGPVIFFVNMLGRLMGGRQGVFFIQCINITLCLCLMYRLLRSSLSRPMALWAMLMPLLSYIIICSGGNQVSDSSLLLSILAVGCFYRWTVCWQENGRPEHPWRYALVYGMLFAECMLSRLSDAMGLSMMVFVVFVVLLAGRRWRCLLLNMGGFIAGFAVIYLPFALYFHANGIFGDMWYASIGYNLEYAKTSDISETISKPSHILYFFMYFIPVIALFVTSLCLLLFDRGRRRLGAAWTAVTLFVMLWLFKSYGNANYGIIYLPLLCVWVLEMKRLASVHPAFRYACPAMLTVLFIGFLNHVRVYPSYLHRADSNYSKMLSGLDDGYKQSFVAYNCEPYVYLINSIRPAYRYFVCQDWAIHNGASLLTKVRETFGSGKAEWILVSGFDDCNIKDILLTDYHVYRRDDANDLILFRRNR